MMRVLFWPLLAALLLEGWFLNLPVWWIVATAATALSVRPRNEMRRRLAHVTHWIHCQPIHFVHSAMMAMTTMISR
jgi:hypothetical protein